MKSFVLHLPRLSSLGPEVAAALRCEDNLPHAETKTATHTVMVTKEQSPGVKKCVPEERQRTYTVTRFGTDLLLDGIADLPDSVAKELTSHDGLGSLAPQQAKSLCGNKGDLSLDGVQAISDEVAEALAQHHGQLSLKGVKKASARAVKTLVNSNTNLPPEVVAEGMKEAK